MRIGLRYVKGLSGELLERIDAEREQRSFVDLEDFSRRTGASVDALESLATAGAFGCFGHDRRGALWSAGALGAVRTRRHTGTTVETLPGVVTGLSAPPLPGMDVVETHAADLATTGLSADAHPTEFFREQLAAEGVVTASDLRTLTDRTVVEVAGVVTHRQRPMTARGVIFLNVEDETGLINVICTPPVWNRHRKVARQSPALRIRGVLECRQGVINLLAQRLRSLDLGLADHLRSRDFR